MSNKPEEVLDRILMKPIEQYKQQLIKQIKDVKNNLKNGVYDDYGNQHENICFDDGYSNAIQDILTKIRKLWKYVQNAIFGDQ